MQYVVFFVFFFFNDTATTEIYTLSLHDALPIYIHERVDPLPRERRAAGGVVLPVAEERSDARRQPLGPAPPVEDHDVVAVAEQRPDQMQADELRAPHHQHAHLCSSWNETRQVERNRVAPRRRPPTACTGFTAPATTRRDMWNGTGSRLVSGYNAPATVRPRGRSSCASRRRSRRSRRSRGDRRRRASGPRRRR